MTLQPQLGSKLAGQNGAVATLILSSIFGWGASTLWSKAELDWHRSRCPIDAFSFGGLGGVLPPFAVGLLAFLAMILAVLLVSSRYGRARAAYASWSPPSRNPSLAQIIKIVWWAISVLLVFTLGLCTVDCFNSYCLSPIGISILRPILGKSRDYRWGEVKKIETICWKSKSKSVFDYRMNAVLVDGYKLQLPEYSLYPPISVSDVAYFPGIRAALVGSALSFDNSAVEPRCGALGALVEKP